MDHQFFMEEAIRIGKEGMNANLGGPFGAVVVKNNTIIGMGSNRVATNFDPTAHAEVVAIRNACTHLQDFQLTNCVLYSSCEPCPMCLGAIFWARPALYFFAASRKDAALAGFDDAFIYDQIAFPPDQREIRGINLMRDEGIQLLKEWIDKEDKILY